MKVEQTKSVRMGILDMSDFQTLHKRFLDLGEKTGRSKLSSYSLTIYYHPDEDITIELGGYDIPDWNRHETSPIFKTEVDALIWLEKKIEEAEKLVEENPYE